MLFKKEEKEILKKAICELTNINIFNGNFDAKHGSWEFMHGVGCIIEHLACEVSEDFANEIMNEFYKNFAKSIEKSLKK